MSWGLPKLPGLVFRDCTKTSHHVCGSLRFHQGHRFPSMKVRGAGGVGTDVDSNAFASTDDSVNYDPSLTYGRVKQPALPAVVPHFVHYDKKCLKFGAFFKQSVYDNPDESYRVRIVNIIYFLEDDTITVMEPKIRNSGIWQGRIVKRAKIPKNDAGEYWTWKDLNVGIDICIYSKVFHTVNCDLFTKEWLQSQGIEMNKEEEMPEDPYIRKLYDKPMLLKKPPKTHEDQLKRFLQNDGKILSFDVVWDNREPDDVCAELTPYKLLYFLVDDTISIKEVNDGRGGKDPFPMLLKKRKVPKKWKERPATFPAVCLETTEEEVSEYYAPPDIVVGETLFILARRFLVLDCDRFTRDYYRTVYNINQPPRIEVPKREQKEYPRKFPPHIGIGTPEDSLQSCLSTIPKPPHKDVIKYNLNASKYLRYLCEMVVIHPEDKGRQFVLSYSLADGSIKIGEIKRRNSGFMEGKFLRSMLLETPESDPNFPTYMTPERFYIGAIVPVFKHRFRIIGCDLYVYRYMCANPDKFPQEAIDNVRNYHLREGNLKDELKMATRDYLEEERRAELDKIVSGPISTMTEMQKCLEALNVKEGSELPAVGPPPPPTTTDLISYDDALRLHRQSHPTHDEVLPLKGILKSGTAGLKDDHQKVVCFTGPAVEKKQEVTPPPKQHAPGERPEFDDDPDFCKRYEDPGTEERKEQREKDICAYEVTPKYDTTGPIDETPEKTLPGYLGTYGVDCKKTPDYMRLSSDAYEQAKQYRNLPQDISPAAKVVADYPLLPPSSVETCVNPPPEQTGPCAPKKHEDVLFECRHVEPRLPCCDPTKRDQTPETKMPASGVC